MKVAKIWLLAFLAIGFPAGSKAQSDNEVAHAPSGNFRLFIVSVSVPPIPNAPFIASVHTLWTRKLEDGTNVSFENYRTIARYSDGRVYQERRTFHPAGDGEQSIIRQMEYADPNLHELIVCNPWKKTCEIRDYSAPMKVPAPPPPGPLDDGKIYLSRVQLGTETVDGMQAIGSTETLSILAGTRGNDQPIEVVKEFWYSPDLGINLIEKRQDPRSGSQDFEVKDLRPGEPDSKLFVPPANFRMIDMRASSAAAPGNSPSR